MVYHSSNRSTRESSSREKSSRQDTKPKNVFRNDGSFLEMFKRMQESSASPSFASPSNSSNPVKASSPSSSQEPVSVSSSYMPSSSKETTSSLPSVSDSIISESVDKVKVNCASDNEGKTFNNKFPIVGKRRGGKVLPTGKVKKLKADSKDEQVEQPKDAWSQYLAEVKKYKETTCSEDVGNRPLVK